MRLKVARDCEVRCLCDDYRVNLAPRDWLRCPPTDELINAPQFQTYISQDIDYAMKFPENDAHEIIRRTANDWIKTHRSGIAKLCHDYDEDPVGGEADPTLAKQVLICSRCKFLDERWHTGAALCGWDQCVTHMCHPKSNRHLSFEFSTRGRDVVIALMKGLGLDPNTTTAQQMDELDLRFFCENCPHSAAHRKGVHGKKAYTWIECVGESRSIFDGANGHVFISLDNACLAAEG